MVPTAEWPEVGSFRDHWRWRPDWTATRPRVLWYLTFGDAAELRSTVAEPEAALRAAGADVIPPEWLHLTVTDVGFADEIDEWSLRAARDSVRRALCEEPPLQLRLGPIGALPGAVVLPARPAEPLRRLRRIVRRATTEVGIPAPDDIDGPYWPHVSLCYVNSRTDHDALWSVVQAAEPRTVEVTCDRLAEVLVARREGHYQWDVLEAMSLSGGAATSARPGREVGGR